MGLWISFWVVMAIGLAIVIGYNYFKRIRPERLKRAKGRDNKKAAAIAAARGFARQNSFRFIAPASLAKGDKTAELDALVVGYFGVLGVKALGYNGEVYGAEKDKEWVQVTGDGERNPFPNPLVEAAADVRVIRDILAAHKLRQLTIEVACVFTDPKAGIGIPKSVGYHTVKTFKEMLKKDKYLEDKGFELDEVEKALRECVQNPGA